MAGARSGLRDLAMGGPAGGAGLAQADLALSEVARPLGLAGQGGLLQRVAVSSMNACTRLTPRR